MTQPDSSRTPKMPLTFSVIINTTDRAKPLRALLGALEHQSYPHFEVIVVVGPTKDDTLAMLANYDGRVRVLRCPVANLSASRNIGLSAARGEIAAYIDDDATPCRTWLEQLARIFADDSIDATGGTAYMTNTDAPGVQHRFGTTSSLAEHVFTRDSSLDGIVPEGESAWWVTRMIGTNMAFRRTAALGIGGFDAYFEWVYDEADIVMRMAAAGHIVHPVREAVVYHNPAVSRNRAHVSGFGKWWVPVKAAIRFAGTHGRAAGESRREIWLRTLHLAHGHQLWLGELRGLGRITPWQLAQLRARGAFAAAQGVAESLVVNVIGDVPRWSAKQNAPFTAEATKATDALDPASETITPFQNHRSALMPSPSPTPRANPITMTEPPLRVCLLSSAYPPAQIDGVSRLTQLMARGLGELGHAVHVIANGERESVCYMDNAWVHRVPTDASRYAQFRHLPELFQLLNRSHTVHTQVRRLMLNEGIQIVDSPLWLCEGLVTATSGMLPVAVRLVTAGKQISEMNAQVNDDRRLVGEMERSLIERAARVLPNTTGTLVNARKVYGLPIGEGKHSIVPYGIVPAPDEAARPFDPGRAHDELTVLFVGRLEKRKGISELFEAIPTVLARVPNARFVIAGADNSSNDGFLRRTGMTYPAFFMQHRARFRDRVTFLGAVSDEKLNALYSACDLFVAPSLYESFGLIYLEAMNYSKPVIGCRAGGVPEVIDDGVNGVLVEPGEARPLAEAIASLLQSPDKLREMGLAGRERVLTQFSYLTMARRFAEAYRATLSVPTPPWGEDGRGGMGEE